MPNRVDCSVSVGSPHPNALVVSLLAGLFSWEILICDIQ